MKAASIALVSAAINQAASPSLHLIDRIEVFGSIARGAPDPNDCDLAIVSKMSQGCPAWDALRQALPSIREQVSEALAVPVHIILLTPVEWAELQLEFFQNSVPLLSDDHVCGDAPKRLTAAPH